MNFSSLEVTSEQQEASDDNEPMQRHYFEPRGIENLIKKKRKKDEDMREMGTQIAFDEVEITK